MAVELSCPQCQAVLRIAEENLGKKSRCPNCSEVFTASEHFDSNESNSISLLSSEGSTASDSQQLGQIVASQGESTSDRLSSFTDPLLGDDGDSRYSVIEESNPYAPVSPVVGEPLLETGEIRPTVIAIDTVIESSWVLFKHYWAMAVVTVIIVAGVNYGVGFVQQLLSVAVEALPGIDPAIQVATQISLAAFAWLVGFWVQLGQSLVMLDLCRGKGVDFARIFSAGSLMLSAVGAALMVVCLLGLLAAVFVGLPVGIAFATDQDPNTIMTVGLAGVGLGADSVHCSVDSFFHEPTSGNRSALRAMGRGRNVMANHKEQSNHSDTFVVGGFCNFGDRVHFGGTCLHPRADSCNARSWSVCASDLRRHLPQSDGTDNGLAQRSSNQGLSDFLPLLLFFVHHFNINCIL